MASAIPNIYCGKIISPTEFQDVLHLQYNLLLFNIISQYDGCTVKFLISYALSCKVGELVCTYHNESRDILGYIAYDRF